VVVMYSPTRTGEATAAVAGPVAAALVDDPVGVELPAPLPAAASGEALQVAPVGGVTVVDEAEAEGGSVEAEAEREPVPLSAQLAIGICVTFTIVFGVDAAPLVNFAHHAALLLAK
jgi:hypothetical protein